MKNRAIKLLLTSFLLSLPCLAWAGPEVQGNSVISNVQLGSLQMLRSNVGGTPIATPNGAGVPASGSDKGDQYVVIRSADQTAVPMTLAPSTELTPVAMITIVPTAVPTAYGTPQFPNTAALRTITVDNSTGDVEIWCAYDGLAATSFPVPAASVYTDNLGARGNVMSGAVGCIHPANTPSAGTIKIYGSK